MKKVSLFAIAALTAILLFTQIPSAEARGCRGGPRVQVGFGVTNVYPGPTVVRRCARPVVAAPVFVPPPSYYYDPYTACYAPVAPVYVASPVYIEEVYMAPQPRPFSFSSFSFSWLFR